MVEGAPDSIISCKPVPGTDCANKTPGFFCNAGAASKPGWPSPTLTLPVTKVDVDDGDNFNFGFLND